MYCFIYFLISTYGYTIDIRILGKDFYKEKDAVNITFNLEKWYEDESLIEFINNKKFDQSTFGEGYNSNDYFISVRELMTRKPESFQGEIPSVLNNVMIFKFDGVVVEKDKAYFLALLLRLAKYYGDKNKIQEKGPELIEYYNEYLKLGADVCGNDYIEEKDVEFFKTILDFYESSEYKNVNSFYPFIKLIVPFLLKNDENITAEDLNEFESLNEENIFQCSKKINLALRTAKHYILEKCFLRPNEAYFIEYIDKFFYEQDVQQ